MVELTFTECMEIDGGVSWGAVFIGTGVALMGVACMVAAPTVGAAAFGYLLYEGGSVAAILGACDV